MNLNHTNYIKNLFYSYVTDDNMSTEKIMFVKHYNMLDMRLEDIEKIVGDVYKKGLLYHRYSKNDIKEPYEPLINGIRYYYQKFFSNDMNVSEFIDRCDVYSLHKEIFVSYLSTGVAHRTEQIITSEVPYEMKKFIQSIIKCYSYISLKTPLLIVLDRFQYAGKSSMKVINELMNNIEGLNIKLLIIYNELQSPLSYIEEYFNKMINKAEDMNIIFEWKSDKELDYGNYRSTFIPNRRFFRDYLVKLRNLYLMLALEDAEHYMGIINSRIAEEKLNIENKDKFDFYVIRSLCNVLEDDNNSAMLNCEKMLPLYNGETDLYESYTYNYICGLAQMNMTQSDLAYKYADRCIAISKKLGDENLEFNAEMIREAAQFSGWRDVFTVDFSKVRVNEEILRKLKKYNYLNTYAYYTIFGYDNDDESIRHFINCKESETFKNGIAVGKMLGNYNFLTSAYTKYIVLFSEKGYHKCGSRFYNEKLKINMLDGDLRRRANLYLGMGYNSIISEQHTKANEYFSNAIDILIKNRNAEGIAEALYNMAINCICVQDFISACNYFDTIFKMLDNLEIETIQICNASKLYGLQAFSYYMVGNEYRAYKCLSNMEIRISHLLYPDEGEEVDYAYWHEDLMIYNFINGILNVNNGDYEQAGEYFEAADSYFEVCKGAMFYIITSFTTEYYRFCKKCGDEAKASEVLENGLSYCRENGYVVKMQNIMHIIDGKSINSRPVTPGLLNVPLESLIDLSYNVGKEKQLSERKKDIKFLSFLQEMLNKEDNDTGTLIENTMITLQNNFNFDSILMLERKKDDVDELYKELRKDISASYNDIFDFMNLMKRAFIVNRTDKSFLEFNRIISLFGKNKIVTLVGVPVMDEQGVNSVFLATVNMHKNFRRSRIFLSDDDLVIIKTAIIQLSSGIERIKSRKNIIEINEKLNSLAITDMLTGLYNRQGFAKKIDEHSNCNNSIAILYADLDNFKYYNDTFGHDVGDVVLVEFAKVFSSVSNKIGYAVRYGGDEFVVVLNNVSKEQVFKVADEIYNKISDGFIDVVSKYIKQDVNIPHNKLVSCSIGIAISYSASNESVMETLQKADKALYFMKRNRKGSYIFWEDIDEQQESN